MRKEIKKAPTIRFRGFTDDWEQRKLGNECFEIVAGGDVDKTKLLQDGKYPVIANALTDEGIIGYYSNEYRIKAPAVTVTGRGDVGHARARKINFTPVVRLLSVVSKHDVDFLAESINQNDIVLESTGVPQLTVPALANYLLCFPPTIKEEKRIGQYFSQLNHLLTLHQRKFDQLKTAKKYFLQNMFPAKGEKVPRIRFQGFTGEWEQRKFGEIAEYKKGPFGSALKKEFFIPDSDISIKVYEQQNAINKDWTLSRYYISQEYAQKLKAFEVHSGDIIVSCAGTIGEIYELPAQSRPGIINQALMRIRVNKDIVCKDIFKLAFSNMIDSLSREFSNGSAIKNIPPFADLKPMKVLLPDKTEQKLIGDFFTDIDKTITLHQRKLNQFQTMKKFMLQNLFI